MRSPDPVARACILLRDVFGPAQDFASYAWEPFRSGVEIARIYGDGTSGPAAALLRYAPGAEVPRHAHTGFEHIVVLSGSQSDERGTYGAGSVLIHAEGTEHTVVSPGGCVVLAFWYSPVAFR
jgi:anti-sigma factor ChrR (cupin superfamily)